MTEREAAHPPDLEERRPGVTRRDGAPGQEPGGGRACDNTAAVVSGTSARSGRAIGGRARVSQPINDHFFLKYRELLDAEDAAFDELEHAAEEGDRSHFDRELAVWRDALVKKLSFLRNVGIELPVALAS